MEKTMLNDHMINSLEIKTIVVVEDDEDMREVIRLTLAEEVRYNVVMFSSPDEVLEATKNFAPDLFIIDYLLVGMNGIELYDILHGMPHLHNVPAIITSASLHMHLVLIEERNLMSLEKPFELDGLLETTRLALG
jgi:DNA-binding NtrC family response regulator